MPRKFCPESIYRGRSFACVSLQIWGDFAGLYNESVSPCACYGLLVVLCTLLFICQWTWTFLRFPYLYSTRVFAVIAAHGQKLALHPLLLFTVVLVPLWGSQRSRWHCPHNGMAQVLLLTYVFACRCGRCCTQAWAYILCRAWLYLIEAFTLVVALTLWRNGASVHPSWAFVYRCGCWCTHARFACRALHGCTSLWFGNFSTSDTFLWIECCSSQK